MEISKHYINENNVLFIIDKLDEYGKEHDINVEYRMGTSIIGDSLTIRLDKCGFVICFSFSIEEIVMMEHVFQLVDEIIKEAKVLERLVPVIENIKEDGVLYADGYIKSR